MQCPNCNQEFILSWKRYINAPMGKMSCPNCQARLVAKHRWFYWPAVILFAILILIPTMMLYYRHYLIYAVICWTGLLIFIGLPFDKYLESRFATLELDKKVSQTKS